MPSLYMAWRGVDDDQNLYWSVSFDGRWWSPEIQLSDRASRDAPALAVFQDKLFMAWRAVAGEDQSLWWATYDANAGLQWSDQHHLADRGSIEGPALAVFQNKLVMAWRGVSGDQGLYWATYDGNSALQWTSQNRLSGSSYDVPALASFEGQLVLAWRGVEGDENLYWATYDGNPNLQWSEQHALSDRASTEGPALIVFQNKLFMIWKGVRGIDEDDQRLYWATYDANDPRGWTDQNVMETLTADQSSIVAVGSPHRPALAAFGNGVVVAGVGPSLVSVSGLPDTGNSDALHPGPNPKTGEPDPPQGPDDSPDHPAPAPPPKGIFYTTFDGSIPSLPITLFTDRASEAAVAQAVYYNAPLSLRSFMLKHGFDPSKGSQPLKSQLNAVTARPFPLRALVGF